MPLKNEQERREYQRMNMARWRSRPKNIEIQKARRKKAYQENHNGLRDKMKAYYLQNKEHLIAKHNDWRKKNQESEMRARKKSRAKNISRAKQSRIELNDAYVASLILTEQRRKLKAAAQRKYIANNKDKIRAWQKQYRSKPEVKRRMNEARKKRMQDPIFREKRLKQKRDHQKRYSEKYDVQNNNWRHHNKERVLERAKEYTRKSIDGISDRYMRILIRQKAKSKIDKVPQQLIELKRAQIILQREIKKQNENT